MKELLYWKKRTDRAEAALSASEADVRKLRRLLDDTSKERDYWYGRHLASDSALAQMRAALERFRYAKERIAADSWDDNPETRGFLQRAAAWANVEFGELSPNELALIGKRIGEPAPYYVEASDSRHG